MIWMDRQIEFYKICVQTELKMSEKLSHPVSIGLIYVHKLTFASQNQL